MRVLWDVLLCLGVASFAFVALCIRAMVQIVLDLVRPLVERGAKARPRATD